jgi:signal recognition particle GTPase
MENLFDTLRPDCEKALQPPPGVSVTRMGIPPDLVHAIVEKILVTVVGGILTTVATQPFRDWWTKRKKALHSEVKTHGTRDPQQLEEARHLLADTEQRMLQELAAVQISDLDDQQVSEIRTEVRTVLIDSNFGDEHANRVTEQISTAIIRQVRAHHGSSHA